MATVEKVEIAVVTKTYQGQEGDRVKAGTRFAVGKEVGGLPVITKARYQALFTGKLVRPFGEEDTKAAPRYARPLDRREVMKEPHNGPTAKKTRQAIRARIRQSETPPAPAQLKGPQRGSQTGEGQSQSSSPAAPASAKSTSSSSAVPKKAGARGNRGQTAAQEPLKSSPSITPTR